MTTPITATASRPKPIPSSRPRLELAVWWHTAGLWEVSRHHIGGEREKYDSSLRIVTVPTDAEAEAYARYVAALEAEVAAWRSAYKVWNAAGGHTDRPTTMHDCWAERSDTEKAREDWWIEKAKS